MLINDAMSLRKDAGRKVLIKHTVNVCLHLVVVCGSFNQ